jgi:ribonuclease HII|tara:strand:+ start:11041 stop:11712 length:672 start_codon:yes stop_codon:yes gene_type:complete
MAKLILGIDEAGRGAVIGPLVIAGALIEDSKALELVKLGVKDSKKLTPKQRADLYHRIRSKIKSHRIVKISPEEIDTNKRADGNLNALELSHMAKIINELKPDVVYLDSIEANTLSVVAKLTPQLKVDCKIIAECGADDTYPIVSAASILAKVDRDDDVASLKHLYGDIGSGYPSDPRTQTFLSNWLNDHNSFPKIVRTTWETASNLVGKAKQKQLGDYVNEI